jgi:glutaredoxin
MGDTGARKDVNNAAYPGKFCTLCVSAVSSLNRFYAIVYLGPAMKIPTVIIYSRPGCHLCEEAKKAMAEAGPAAFELQEVNIDEHPEMLALYQYDIPVVFIEGVKAFKHRVDAREFKRRLDRPRFG